MLIEGAQGEAELTKYWLSTFQADIPFAELVDGARLRGRIGRDYQELEQELGLSRYEGHGWHGFHVTLFIAAYGFLTVAFPKSLDRCPCCQASANIPPSSLPL